MKLKGYALGFLLFLVWGGYFAFQRPQDVDLATLTKALPHQDLTGKIILGFHGTTKEDESVKRLLVQLKTGRLGGVIFFSRNLVSPSQTKQLIADLKSASPTPFWIAIDQEGGLIQTLRFTSYLRPREVARTLTPEKAYAHYLKMAKELHDLGFNLNFGGVLDLDSPESPIIGGLDRSYGRDPQIVAAYAESFVRAHKQAGVTPCLKHYPGHGFALQDSHAKLTDITLTKDPNERTPFRLMIQRDLAPMIMSAHLMDRSADPKDPVSLSATFLKRELRGKDAFKGLIVTDDLHMGAIIQHYTMEEAVTKALAAGNDLLIISNNKRSDLLEAFYNLVRPLKNRLRQIGILS